MNNETYRDRPISTRNIEVNAYEYDNSAILIEGRLVDERFCATYPMSGGLRPPGIIHDMVIRFVLRLPKMAIESIEVDMNRVPREECLNTKDSLEPLVGMKIRSGFTDRVRERVGGVKGCTHLTALIVTMAPAAMQAAWTFAAREPLNPAKYGINALKFLENTCQTWRSDGAAMAELRSALEK